MRPDLTDITLVVDRSGSMESIWNDAEGGVNAFIEEQSKQPGEALLTLVQFDTDYEFVHNGVPIQDVPKYELQPRGMTALLDAVGRAINETGERMAKMAEHGGGGTGSNAMGMGMGAGFGMMMPAMLLLLIPMFVWLPVLKNPDSGFATVAFSLSPSAPAKSSQVESSTRALTRYAK